MSQSQELLQRQNKYGASVEDGIAVMTVTHAILCNETTAVVLELEKLEGNGEVLIMDVWDQLSDQARQCVADAWCSDDYE